MKLHKFFKRAAAVLMAAVTALSLLPATAFAATGDVGTISFTYTYDSNGSPMRYNSGATINGYHAGGTGNYKYRMYVDGSNAFCLQPGVPLKTGDTLTESASATWDALSAGQQKAVGLALFYGYQGNRGSLTGSDDEKWLATQTLVWEFVTGCREPKAPYTQTITTVYALHFGSNYPNSGAAAAYDQIVSMLEEHSTVPSFLDGGTRELEYRDGKYTLTLTDSNGVLPDFDISVSDRSVSVEKSGNTLTLTSAEAFSGSVRITASRNNIPVVSENAKLIAYGDPDLQDVVTGVENAEPVTAYLNVETPTGSVALKKTSEDGVVSGIRFTIEGNGISRTVTTGSDGTITIPNLTPGVYTVTEQSMDRYEPQNSQRVTVIGGQTATVTFNNTLKRGDLTVTKTSEDGLAEGMTFHLYGTSLSGLAVDEYATTDSSGKVYFTDVLIGTGYVLEEVDTPVRYVVPDSQTAAIEWNKVTEKGFANVLKKWQATVTKSDAETGTAQGDASLAGAVYGVYKSDQLMDSYTTDENGQFTTSYYVCGDDWSIREISPSEGYLLDSTSYHVGAEATLYTVEYNQTANDVAEQVIKGKIALIKHTDDGETQLETPEAGAEFSVYLKSSGSYDAAAESERDYLICDETGYAATKDLPYGIYTVHQVSGWEGRELLPDFDVYIAQDGQVYRYLANNANFESFIKIVKVDAETGKTIPYAGAGFQLYRPDGSKVEMTFTYPEVTTIDTFYTNDEGYLITPETLEYGTGYSLVEVSAPYGYVLNSEPVYFDVTADNATEESAVTVVEVTKENMAQKGVIEISKTGEVFATVTEKGVYQPVYEVQGLPGAVYEITAAGDVYTLDGTLRYSAGEVVDTVTTDETGMAESKALYLGKYEIRETEAPYGMVLNTEVRTVELVYAGQEVEITETAASFYNDRQKVSLSLQKALEQDETFGIGMNGEITAVTFGLYAAGELTAADGSVIPADGIVGIVSLDEEGFGACYTDLPFGSYYFRELSTDGHYLLSDTKYPVVFEYAGQDTALVQLFANNGEPIDNDLIYGEIHGLKKDDSGNALGGAMIGLFRSDCTEFTTENALLTATSAEDGSFSFVQVPYGNWIVHEIQAPAGYVLSGESYPVTIDADGAVVEVEIENTRIRGTVQLTKVDADYPDNKLTGAKFEIYRDSDGNQELDETDELLGTLTEVSAGIYEMSELTYGGYFVKETQAPEGFYLDENAYYFDIAEHGKTVTVENEAGKGFLNQAQKGALKIVKTSSNGKVEGFSFRVTGGNGYEQVFTTDKNGEIVIEGLRIGEYTVSEVSDSASAGYVLPENKTVTVTEGTAVTVEMHNELRDTPKTGDSSSPALWIALMGAAAAGAAVCGVLAFKNKKKKEDA